MSSLGNVPRRNMSAEDKAIAARMSLMSYLAELHMKAGVDREAANKAAFAQAVKLNRKQAEEKLAELKAAK